VGTRNEAVKRIKQAALMIGKKSVMTALANQVPFFALPIVNKITSLLVEKILDLAIDKGEMGIFFLFIDIRGSVEGQQFEQAMEANEIAQSIGTEKEKQDAENNVVIALRRLKFTA
jgi:hypothetical protein